MKPVLRHSAVAEDPSESEIFFRLVNRAIVGASSGYLCAARCEGSKRLESALLSAAAAVAGDAIHRTPQFQTACAAALRPPLLSARRVLKTLEKNPGEALIAAGTAVFLANISRRP